MSITVSALFVYPIKSAAGTAVDAIELDEFGPMHDRHWMLVDGNDRFMSQREAGALALIRPTLHGDGLLLQREGQQPYHVSRPLADAPSRLVTIWDDVVPALDAGDDAAAWCTAATGMECRLVNMAPYARRPLQHKYAGPLDSAERFVSLNDGAPMLILGEGSLTELNRRLEAKRVAPVGVDRFRPNVLLSGTSDQEEDTWLEINIGTESIGIGSRCGRCVMTTVNQQSGVRSSASVDEPGGEPLRTIASYRRDGGSVMFGMNATHRVPCVLRVGDVVTVVRKRD
ncbi:MAG: MOSC domain-containing protein [Phycisphaerae bacterium]|nr:MOSC domain-containing protein [Gemmatimonadaceae bacterium]